jgi:hypothetical protein
VSGVFSKKKDGEIFFKKEAGKLAEEAKARFSHLII